ncbi:hypothetical protein HBI56_095510 [Parastagonospora nodorum]|uniref:Uncharacterized protein n=1 Tax=Phaeosphaeria nodorum (strain SN15 / ATCC MYA-4574 / FGSC 10173) TaxID=321614 RepID=A0A7U2F8C1_PHANO|nr:hypothetical protein HBH56_090820 [Parastagonospora nodorum]QRC98254.1 hypothetical protein JI435_435520 [Parastagonospora nodorum SN15]KAH3936649.1 hypothetical protein HBH54_025460 [Parastagonospora nodorum]KAH3945562.1 hypothetical protein HBH53_142560 [Parastagonospora nodorum]KAH4030103.1 hypothetical protein HBI13_036900 [Parastagonospora nodorum]
MPEPRLRPTLIVLSAAHDDASAANGDASAPSQIQGFHGTHQNRLDARPTTCRTNIAGAPTHIASRANTKNPASLRRHSTTIAHALRGMRVACTRNTVWHS